MQDTGQKLCSLSCIHARRSIVPSRSEGSPQKLDCRSNPPYLDCAYLSHHRLVEPSLSSVKMNRLFPNCTLRSADGVAHARGESQWPLGTRHRCLSTSSPHAASVLGENPKVQRDNDKLLAAGFRFNSSPPSSPSSVASFVPVRSIITFSRCDDVELRLCSSSRAAASGKLLQ